MKEQLNLLIKVQTIDTNIQRSEEIEKIFQDKMFRIDEVLKDEEEKIEKEKQIMQNLEKERRKLERNLDEALEHKQRSEDKLFSIKTNKEYRAALQEIESLKQSIKEREDEILEIMEKAESQKRLIIESEEKLKKNRARHEKEKKQLKHDLEQHLLTIKQQQELRKTLIETIDPEILKKYQKIKGIRNGLAVVMAENEQCLGCNMKIPPQFYNEVIAGKKIITCPHCSRMLYVKGNTDEKEQ